MESRGRGQSTPKNHRENGAIKMAKLIEQLEEALTTQQQAEEEMEMIIEQLNDGEMIADEFIEEYEDKEAAANEALIKAAMAHMPALAANALETVHESQPTDAIRIAVGYAEAVTGIVFLAHS